MHLPAAPPPWYQRWWTRATMIVARALGQIDMGADYRPGISARPSYDPDASLSAMAAFPWVYAAMMRASGDLAGLPLRAYQTRGGRQEELPPDHPLMKLLRRPNARWSGRQLRRQLYVDLRLVGNSFAVRLGEGRILTLMRLHPSRVQIQPDRRLGYGDYVFSGTGDRQVIPADQVYHVRAPSWQDDPRGLWGTGAIESLHNDLTTDRRASAATATLSKRPRPDLLVSPNGEGEMLTREVREEIGKQLDRMLADGGTVVLPQGLNINTPSWSPRDLEFPQLRQLVREAVLAVTGVPPHLVGLPVANYAQSQEQTLCYWELQQSIAADIEDAMLDPLAELFGSGITVRHDFSKVDALQASRSARLARVQTWWAMGFDPVEMAKYEGFRDLPENALEPAPAPAADASATASAALPLRRDTPAPTDAAEAVEVARKAVWEAWVERAHAPAERRLSGVLTGFLRDQARRLADNAAAAASQQQAAGAPLRRDLLDVLLALVWNEATERTALSTAVRIHLSEIMRQAWAATSAQIPSAELAWSPTLISEPVAAQIATMVSQVNGQTKAAVRQCLIDGLAAGESVNEIQARIVDAAAFAPPRALAVSRTEATKAVNSGTLTVYRQAQAAGVSIRKEWLSARDGSTRDAHRALDGQRREVGEDFVVPAGSDYAGASAPGPGLFSAAALCVNCRCTTLPVVED